MSLPKSTRVIGVIRNWMAQTIAQGNPITNEQVRSWDDMLAQAESDLRDRELQLLVAEDDAMVAKTGDRICAADAEFILDSVHALVQRLSHHAVQAATRAELGEIDRISSAIIDATKTLATGIARADHVSKTEPKTMDDLSTQSGINAAMAEAATMTVNEAVEDNNGITIIAGKPHMTDAKGRFVPLDSVKATDKLQDETVRKIIAYAEPLAAQVARFREHTFADVDSLMALLAQEYGVKMGGAKGNITLTTIDGCLKVQVAIGDNITFGPELQVAKALVDECLRDWTDGARAELRAMVERAFQTDKEGKISPSELLGLRRIESLDERWHRAMKALTDSIRVLSTKRYVRAYRRNSPMDAWRAITIDVASAGGAS